MNLVQEKEAGCPYCGEPITLVIDCSVSSQSYVEDCQVCCRPIIVRYQVHEDQFGEPVVELSVDPEDL